MTQRSYLLFKVQGTQVLRGTWLLPRYSKRFLEVVSYYFSTIKGHKVSEEYFVMPWYYGKYLTTMVVPYKVAGYHGGTMQGT
jgi:hypothetical protein